MKKIKEEFGYDSERQAVKDYQALNRNFMYLNYPLIADEVISQTNISQGYILDLGTGLGSLACEFARRLPQSKIYGLDISPEMITEAKVAVEPEQLNNLEFVCADAQQMNFPDNHFDLVVSFGLLHHLQDIKITFAQLKRVLKEKAVAYIYDLQADAPQEIVAEIAAGMNPGQRRAFLESVKEALSAAFLENLLSGLGFAEYSVSTLKFSRRTIIKNIRLLKESRLMGGRFNKVLMQCFLRK